MSAGDVVTIGAGFLAGYLARMLWTRVRTRRRLARSRGAR